MSENESVLKCDRCGEPITELTAGLIGWREYRDDDLEVDPLAELFPEVAHKACCGASGDPQMWTELCDSHDPANGIRELRYIVDGKPWSASGIKRLAEIIDAATKVPVGAWVASEEERERMLERDARQRTAAVAAVKSTAGDRGR